MARPERDDGVIDAFLQELHRGAVPEHGMHPILTALSVWVERRRYDLKDVLKIR
jgi:hypothetical protein